MVNKSLCVFEICKYTLGGVEDTTLVSMKKSFQTIILASTLKPLCCYYREREKSGYREDFETFKNF